jgi:hypothetical protein
MRDIGHITGKLTLSILLIKYQEIKVMDLLKGVELRLNLLIDHFVPIIP